MLRIIDSIKSILFLILVAETIIIGFNHFKKKTDIDFYWFKKKYYYYSYKIKLKKKYKYENILWLYISKYSLKYNIDPALVLAVIAQESAFKANVVSHAGCIGLMQLEPRTARWLGVQNSYDIEQNIKGGIRYLRILSDQYDSIKLILTAYNAGPGNVSRYNGIPPFKETLNYVKKVPARYYKYKKLLYTEKIDPVQLIINERERLS